MRSGPSGDPRGDPVVANGLALCKLRHAAYDRHILGGTLDYVVEIRRDILEEVEKPRREFLEMRYVEFRRAG